MQIGLELWLLHSLYLSILGYSTPGTVTWNHFIRRIEDHTSVMRIRR